MIIHPKTICAICLALKTKQLLCLETLLIKDFNEEINDTVDYIALEDGWIRLSPSTGYQYKNTQTAQTWNKSRETCQNMGGDLIVYGIQETKIRKYVRNYSIIKLKQGVFKTSPAMKFYPVYPQFTIFLQSN